MTTKARPEAISPPKIDRLRARPSSSKAEKSLAPAPNTASASASQHHSKPVQSPPRLRVSAKGFDLEPARSPTWVMKRMSSKGQVRDTTWPKKSARHINSELIEPSRASKATLASRASATAMAPKAPTRESFMINRARSRPSAPPRPSATSARPSSWNAPVSNTPAAVPKTATTKGASGVSGSSSSSSQLRPASRPPTSQPTPGKCPALARSMSGLKPTHSASGPVTGMRVKNCSASR